VAGRCLARQLRHVQWPGSLSPGRKHDDSHPVHLDLVGVFSDDFFIEIIIQ